MKFLHASARIVRCKTCKYNFLEIHKQYVKDLIA